MKHFKTFLAEGMSTEVSTALETVLGISWESVVKGDDDILWDAMGYGKDGKMNSKFKTASTYWKLGTKADNLKNLKILGTKINTSKAKPSGDKYTFQSAGKITADWSDWGASNNTAKADIILGDKHYSVKNADGAQLMSGKKGESAATTQAAVKKASGGLDPSKSPVQELLASIDKLKTVTTEGYFASADNLRRLKANADENTTLWMLAKVLTKEKVQYEKEEKIYAKKKKGFGNVSLKKYGSETKAFEKLIELSKDKNKKKAKDAKKKIKNIKAMEQLEKEWKEAWPPGASGKTKITYDKKDNLLFKHAKKERGKSFAGWSDVGKLGSTGKPSLGREIPKILKPDGQFGGKKPSLTFQTKMGEENKKFTHWVEGKFANNAQDVQDRLIALFKDNDKFKREFCYEAASGAQKFGDTPQKADSMLSWKPSAKGVQDFVIDTYQMKNSGAKIITKYSDKMTTEVNWKSSSKNNHEGYNVYQNIRLGLGQIEEETIHAQDVLIEEYAQLKNSLQEGIINEAGFFSKLKDMAKNFVATIKEFGKRIVNWFKEAIEKIKSAASAGVEALGNVFGFGMDVQTNADKELSISI